MTTVIEVQDISKRFTIHHERNQTLKERILHPRSGSSEIFDALNDINFSVAQGETLGIVGHNGSGKSTLLKCICGVLKPTTGQIRLRGNLAALLELGAGFQHELSGRDNVYLYGSMLGFTRKMVDAIFDDVVAFSELEHFIDTPVKFYSSGMYVRLAFAVAVNVNPDILVVDEVLAVGDERFQAKCIDRIRRFQREGRTILLVTHQADTVRAICDRAIVLDHGNMVADGPVTDALRIFRERLLGDVIDHRPGGSGVVSIDGLSAPSGSFEVRHGSNLRFDATLSCDHAVSGNLVIEVFTRTGLLVSRNDAEAAPVTLRPGVNKVGVELANVPLLDGVYDINVGLVEPQGATMLAWREKAASLQVLYDGRSSGVVGIESSVTQW
ncbi:MAG: ATP-binding cassette domain-containing protein [Actinomycetales bacterium]|nr:ATP-binding cassette domain-containing protein [Actinomycetales bacterium]